LDFSVVAEREERERREVGARAFTGHDEPPGAELAFTVGGEPADRGDAVLKTGGMRVLRRQSIVDDDNGHVSGVREPQQRLVPSIYTAKRPAATV
jgi:hypothetical protein